MALYLTLNCNLGCSYCFCGKKYKQDMSKETLKKSMSFFNSVSNKERNSITFFGGEPMLKFDLIKYAVDLNRSVYNNKFKFNITTNGTLFNEENSKFLRENDIGILLSLDGDKKTHDKNRCFALSKTGSWDTIINNVRTYFENQLPVRLTFTTETVINLYDNLNTLINMGFRNIAFYPADGYNWNEEDIFTFDRQIDRIANLYLNEYRLSHRLGIHWLDKSIRSHILGGGSKCMPGLSQFAVAPDETLYPCNRTNFSDPSLKIGTLDFGFEKNKLDYIKAELLKSDPECEECALKNRCNACPIELMENGGRMYNIPGWYCHMNQYVIKAADKVASILYNEKNKLFLNNFYHANIEFEDYND